MAPGAPMAALSEPRAAWARPAATARAARPANRTPACPHAVLRSPLARPRRHSRWAAAAAPPPTAQQPAHDPAAPAAAASAPPLVLPLGPLSSEAAGLVGADAVEVDVTGSALHLGLDMEWRLSFSTDGSFIEELDSPHMSCASGYAAPPAAAEGAAGEDAASSSSGSGSSSSDASTASSSPGSYFRAGGVCWGWDDAGCARQLALDDEEGQLLSMWVRTGLWVLPRISRQLDIAPATPVEAASCAATAASSSSNDDDDDDEGSSSSASSSSSAGEETAWVKLRLRGGGQVTALVEVCSADWRPLSLRLCLAGEHELWSFSDWRQWQPGLWLVAGASQTNTGRDGTVSEFSLSTLQLRRPADGGSSGGSSSSSGASRFAQPPTPLLPEDSAFLPGVPEEVPAWHTPSGHSLVRPLLNGREVGYFIFDTGASGFVLDPSVGEALGLRAFGQLQVTSMVGRLASRFRRADALQLGPLRMARPLFMELSMAGLVSGVPDGGRVVGIVGYDILRRAVVHLPPPPRRAALPPGAVVDSPAAAVAVSVKAAQARREALPYVLRFQHPEAAGSSSHGGAAAAGATGAPAVPASAPPSRGSSSPSHAPAGTASSSTAAAAATLSSSSSSAARAQQAAQPAAAAAGGREWLPLVMVSSLPHVELELVTAEGRRHRGLFMMDSGAGGLELILNAKAAKALALGPGSHPTHIKGLGENGGARMEAHRCQLAEVRLGATAFHGVQALYHRGASSGGLDLSQHTSGIICGGLLSHCALTFDYARMRVAVAGPAAGACAS